MLHLAEGERFASDISELLRSQGLLGVSGGIQIDINTVPKRTSTSFIDGHKCDHNCLREYGSGYDCPAASMINKGLKTDFPPSQLLERAIVSAAEGVRMANHMLIDNGDFNDYSQRFGLPVEVRDTVRQVLRGEQVQVNLFGGNPEMHKGVFDLIESLVQSDPLLTVNLTTTGKKSITSEGWLDKLATSSISSVALSCDDIDLEVLESASTMNDYELVKAWRQISPLQGAKQKALEAIYTARRLSQNPSWDRPIIFNMVLHRGNLGEAENLTRELNRQFPGSLVNPFPAQSSIDNGAPTFEVGDLPRLEQVLDWAIGEHVLPSSDVRLVPRLHYWLMLKAAYETFEPERNLRAMSGYGVWNCYDNPGAARYVQIGASRSLWEEGKEVAGGHLSCYWNHSVTDNSVQIWNEAPTRVAKYIRGDIYNIAHGQTEPCPGCIMPRLTYDMYSQEVGMNKELAPAYLELRQQYLGF